MGLEFNTTQHALLRLLLHNKPGLTVEALMRALGVSRNAVRQHLAALERDGAVAKGPTQPTGGRPEQVYVITPDGQELFPRRYSWFSELLMRALEAQLGQDKAGAQLEEMGRAVGEDLRARGPADGDLRARVEALSGTMAELGYEAKAVSEEGAPQIEAQNCVFHQLAMQHPQICRFDLALMAASTGAVVEHRACMARGDAKCCFRFAAKPGV
jgi:predicted ArsR family transcriptional regulator